MKRSTVAGTTTVGIILILCISLILINLLTLQYEVIFSDGAWVLDGKIYGFPLPYIFADTITSLEKAVAVPYLIVDYITYSIVTLILYLISKSIVRRLSLRINRKLSAFVFIAVIAISTTLLIFDISQAALWHYWPMGGIDYGQDQLVLKEIFVGLYW